MLQGISTSGVLPKPLTLVALSGYSRDHPATQSMQSSITY
jgi:hypothetical protein